MLDIQNVNLSELPNVPCRDGQSIYKGFVIGLDGKTIIGKYDHNLDIALTSGAGSDDFTETITKWSLFSKIQFPENRWLIENYIPAGGFVILAAPSGEKKTWLALEIAKSIAEGKKFLGEYGVIKGRVLYLNGEMSQREFQRRGVLLGFNPDIEIFISNREVDLYKNEAMVEWLLEYINEQGINLVVLDTFRAFAGGMKEEKAEEVREFFNRLKPLKDLGVALLILDHCRKPSRFEGHVPKKEQLFASQDKVASVEMLFMLKSQAGSDEVYVYQLKNRLGKEIEPIFIAMKDVLNEQGEAIALEWVFKGLAIEPEYKSIQAQEIILTLLSDGGKTTNEIIQIIKDAGIAEKNVRQALRVLVGNGQIKDTKKVGRQKYYSLSELKTGISNEDIDSVFGAT